jgi:transposase-like protein
MPKYTEQAVRDAVAAARSLSEALRTLGLRPAGGNHRTLHRLIAKYGISVDHMDPKWALRRAPRNCATPLPEILVVDSTFHRGHLKERLFHEGVKKRRCELCGLGEEWCGRPMSLTLDHINGVPTDNRIGNLRIVCPNCAATLDTHCGRKNRIDRDPRACLHCGSEFIPKYPTHRYCSQRCGIHSKGSHEPQPERRKVPRPSHQQLLSDLQTMSFVAVGRKYGVSDNAVRKWLRYYERERAGLTPAEAETTETAVDSGMAPDARLDGAGSEARDLELRLAAAANDEAVGLADRVRPDDGDRELGLRGQPALVEGCSQVDGPALA